MENPKEEPKSKLTNQKYLDKIKTDGVTEEFLKQKTLEKVAERLNPYVLNGRTPFKEGFIACAKWQQERSYSEKQMDDAYDKGFKDATERRYSEEEVKRIIELTLIEYSDFVLADIPHWFEKFKNK
jgi:hypothetical protein